VNGQAGIQRGSVRFEDVRVTYAGLDRPAVDGVTFEVPAGTFVVLLGPSGCGKSTLLRTVNRLVEPQAGRIFVDGTDVQAVSATDLRRGIGYVIQAIGLFAHMSVAENIAVVPELLKWDKTRIAGRTDELLRLVHLDPQRYRDRYPRELSGGEQQRIGVARALAAEPRLLLMDEPFGAVDALVRTALQEETRRIQRALGTTFLFVTHDVEEALRIADRIVIMQDGKIVQYDEPLRILSNPASTYVAQLMETHDAVRRLSLLCVRDALEPMTDARFSTAGAHTNGVRRSIPIQATLREALTAFLDGADRVEVHDSERLAGTLTFDDIRAAMRSAR